MNTNILDREKYKQMIRPLNTEDDKADCFKHLTFSNKHLLICHNTYTSEHINIIIEESNYVIWHYVDTIENIVGLALVKILKKNVLDILLVCAIHNEERLGSMVAYSVCSFALFKKCKKIYTAPRTHELRNTFMKYGFEHLRGVPNIDEVLVKQLNPQKTLKIHSKTKRSRQAHKFW
jgi:hypothetical protein